MLIFIGSGGRFFFCVSYICAYISITYMTDWDKKKINTQSVCAMQMWNRFNKLSINANQKKMCIYIDIIGWEGREIAAACAHVLYSIEYGRVGRKKNFIQSKAFCEINAADDVVAADARQSLLIFYSYNYGDARAVHILCIIPKPIYIYILV